MPKDKTLKRMRLLRRNADSMRACGAPKAERLFLNAERNLARKTGKDKK